MKESNRAWSATLLTLSLGVLSGATGFVGGGRMSGELGLDRLNDAFIGVIVGGLVGVAGGLVLSRALEPRRLRTVAIGSLLVAGALIVYIATLAYLPRDERGRM